MTSSTNFLSLASLAFVDELQMVSSLVPTLMTCLSPWNDQHAVGTLSSMLMVQRLPVAFTMRVSTPPFCLPTILREQVLIAFLIIVFIFFIYALIC